jgi:hypothetical protein
MRHVGIPVRRLPAFARVDAALLDEFRPNVVVALDQEPSLACVDLVALREYKRAHGCLRLFVATRDDVFEPAEMTEGDARRLQRAIAGDGADAFMSLYEPECFPRMQRAWVDAGFRSISVPQSGNPIHDVPRDVPRVHDYFYTSVCTPERLRATWSELRGIVAIIAATGPARDGLRGTRRSRPRTMPARFGLRRGSPGAASSRASGISRSS